MLKISRTASWLLLLSALVVRSTGLARAVPPSHPLVMDWIGEEGVDNHTGDGAMDAWENWQGNSEFISANPTVINYYPPQAGDTLRMENLSLWGGSHHDITVGSIASDSYLQVEINATFTGGTLDIGAIRIAAIGFPIVFNGTSLSADNIIAAATNTNEVEFNNAELITDDLSFRGVKAVDSEIEASVIGVYPYIGASPFATNIRQSTVHALGAFIGFGDDPDQVAAMLLEDHTSAEFEQYLLIGATNSGQLTVSNSSDVDAQNAYVNVGDLGEGDLYVTESSILQADSLNVGVHDEGSVAVDSHSLIVSHAGVVGVGVDSTGTVNLENNGEWETDSLVVGQNGFGYVYVRDGGTLTVKGSTGLGPEGTGVGILSLIGSQTPLLAPPVAEFNGPLTVGFGSSVFVDQEALLRVVDDSLVVDDFGTVTIQGAGAELRVDQSAYIDGHLTLRDRGRGRMQSLFINGTVTVSGSLETGGAITIGEQSSLAPLGSIQVNHGGTLSGESAVIEGDLIINGGSTWGLWGWDDDFGDWDIDGDVTVEEGGALALNIGGLAVDHHDVINVGGAANIEGRVVLKFVDGFAPSIGDSFTLIVGDDLQIDPTIQVRNLAPGWQYSVSQAGGMWTVTSLGAGVATKAADFNGDGLVNGGDLASLAAHFGMIDVASQADGDADADFDVDGADLLALQRQLHVPTIVGATQPIPEPCSATIALLAGCGLALCKARDRESVGQSLD